MGYPGHIYLPPPPFPYLGSQAIVDRPLPKVSLVAPVPWAAPAALTWSPFEYLSAFLVAVLATALTLWFLVALGFLS